MQGTSQVSFTSGHQGFPFTSTALDVVLVKLRSDVLPSTLATHHGLPVELVVLEEILHTLALEGAETTLEGVLVAVILLDVDTNTPIIEELSAAHNALLLPGLVVLALVVLEGKFRMQHGATLAAVERGKPREGEQC